MKAPRRLQNCSKMCEKCSRTIEGRNILYSTRLHCDCQSRTASEWPRPINRPSEYWISSLEKLLDIKSVQEKTIDLHRSRRNRQRLESSSCCSSQCEFIGVDHQRRSWPTRTRNPTKKGIRGSEMSSAPSNTTQFLIEDYDLRYNSVDKDKSLFLSSPEHILTLGQTQNGILGTQISLNRDALDEIDFDQFSLESTENVNTTMMPQLFDEQFEKMNFEELYSEVNGCETSRV